MKSSINRILQDIELKKQELKEAYLELRSKYGFSRKGKKIIFSKEAIIRGKKFKKPLQKIFLSPNLRHVLSIPFIYLIIIPIAILDLFLWLYQQTALRLYKIPLVKRKDYLVFDRKELAYLNVLEKVNCLYCSYANGIFSYAVEIAGRTEKYRCPIKHAKRGEGAHHREKCFSDYGDAEEFRKEYNNIRCFQKNISQENG
ncbi:MAG: hypothetical protein GXP45_02845 [bacterium]|nr:hypothetical protein [bacterium]